ncbi:response regulator [Kordiimonas sp.]|uniref:response regulator n=1 Tax=Kordiimonas sp. TaxID=1970157 RepID=UPI003A8E6E8D
MDMVSFAGKSALIVEDDPTSMSYVSRMIVQVGFKSFGEAKDGSDALHLLDHNDYDVILCDISMDGMNGIEFVKEFKNNYRGRYAPNKVRTPVIFITSSRDPKVVEQAKLLGVKGYLLKPFGKDKLVQRLTVAGVHH